MPMSWVTEALAHPPLTEAEAAAIEARVKTFEARAGIQAVAAVVERSDVYHGLRWRAFAFAVSLAGLFVVALEALCPAAPDVTHGRTPCCSR